MWGAIKPGKGFTLFISNEDMDNIIGMIESTWNSGALIDEIQVH